MKINEIINEDISRRDFLKGAGAAAGSAALAGCAHKKIEPPEEDKFSRFKMPPMRSNMEPSHPSTEFKKLDSDVYHKIQPQYPGMWQVGSVSAFGHWWDLINTGKYKGSYIRLIQDTKWKSAGGDGSTSYHAEIAPGELIRNEVARQAKLKKDKEDDVNRRARASGLYEEPIEEAATEESIKKVNSLFSR
jgi:hypothetical protein